MRIVQIVPSLAEKHGGPSKSVRALADHLAAQGNEVELLATRERTESVAVDRSAAAAIRVFERTWPERIVRSPGLRAHLQAGSADIVHHHALWLRTLHYAHDAARRQRVPLVISPRGMLSDWAYHHHRGRKQLAATLLHSGAMQAAAGWHATSQDEANDIRKRGYTQPICVAPNGVPIPSTEALVAARNFWHRTCPPTDRRPVALFYSRLHRKKRVRELIDLWRSAERGDWMLLIAGSTEEYSASQLGAELAAAGCANIAVHDSAGAPPPYAIASLFLLPSHSENFGLVVAEALAAGVPALVTDSTPWAGLSGIDAGWCVPWERYGETLATALATPLEDLAGRGARGRIWMQRDFSWEGAARRVAEFYRELRHGR